MKYVEQVKSFILLFLVLLSLLFTFLIWNYKPDYLRADEKPKNPEMISEEKRLEEVIRPYRLLFSTEKGFKGTSSTEEIDTFINYLNKPEIKNLSLIDATVSENEINERIRMKSRMTMFFQTEVPIQVLYEIFSMEEAKENEATFNRLIIDWATLRQNRHVQMYFLSTTDQAGYQANLAIPNIEAFEQLFVEKPESLPAYVEFERQKNLSLYLVEEPLQATQYKYSKEEIPVGKLKSILFEEPTIAQKTSEGVQDKYSDSMSLLTLDTNMKVMNYVYPAAESSAPITRYELLNDTFDFINEHGGFTGDYRLASMNTERRVVEYQLYWQGYPVFGSTEALTRLITTWGEENIYRYRRPYYLLDPGIYEKSTKELEAGKDLIQHINSTNEMNLSKVDDIVIGYYLTENIEKKVYEMEPGWFILRENSWTPLIMELWGGDEYGLE
jgi:regulatory protein YycH of two-component signal transduction system YycFG